MLQLLLLLYNDFQFEGVYTILILLKCNIHTYRLNKLSYYCYIMIFSLKEFILY